MNGTNEFLWQKLLINTFIRISQHFLNALAYANFRIIQIYNFLVGCLHFTSIHFNIHSNAILRRQLAKRRQASTKWRRRRRRRLNGHGKHDTRRHDSAWLGNTGESWRTPAALFVRFFFFLLLLFVALGLHFLRTFWRFCCRCCCSCICDSRYCCSSCCCVSFFIWLLRYFLCRLPFCVHTLAGVCVCMCVFTNWS